MVEVHRRPKPLLYVIVLIIFIGISLLVIGGTMLYLQSPVDSKSDTSIKVEIPQGTSTRKIGTILKEKNLIKNELYFSIYVRMHSTKALKASTYSLKKSMSLKEIVNVLEEGSKVESLRLTFKEGKRMTDYAEVIAKDTSYTKEQVLEEVNNKEFLTGLIEKYWFLTDDIMQEGIYYPLEGYLAPDTYFFEKDVKLDKIIETLLDEEEKNLEKYKDLLLKNNIHDIVTMASMAELEGKKLEDRKNIVGVFNNRLAIHIHLGSDVTTYYAFQKPMTEKLTSEEFNTPNPYNTRPTNKDGLPIGPICSPSKESLEAAIYPTDNEYMYFVASTKGVVYFSKTLAEQEKVIQDLKSKGEW